MSFFEWEKGQRKGKRGLMWANEFQTRKNLKWKISSRQQQKKRRHCFCAFVLLHLSTLNKSNFLIKYSRPLSPSLAFPYSSLVLDRHLNSLLARIEQAYTHSLSLSLSLSFSKYIEEEQFEQSLSPFGTWWKHHGRWSIEFLPGPFNVRIFQLGLHLHVLPPACHACPSSLSGLSPSPPRWHDFVVNKQQHFLTIHHSLSLWLNQFESI